MESARYYTQRNSQIQVPRHALFAARKPSFVHSKYRNRVSSHISAMRSRNQPAEATTERSFLSKAFNSSFSIANTSENQPVYVPVYRAQLLNERSYLRNVSNKNSKFYYRAHREVKGKENDEIEHQKGTQLLVKNSFYEDLERMEEKLSRFYEKLGRRG